MIHSRRGVFIVWLLGTLAVPGVKAQETDWARTAELADRKLLSTPKDSRVWADLVEARLALNDAPRAAEALKIWRHNVPNVRKSAPVIEKLQGDLEQARGNAAAAAEAWEIYVRLVPDDVEGWERLTDAEEALKHFNGAIDAVSAAIKLDPTAGRYARRAKLWSRLRDWEHAAADVTAGNKLDATDEDLQKLFPVFERSAKWLPALKALDAAVLKNAQRPEESVLLVDRAGFLAAEGWIEPAYEDADAAFRKAPGSVRAEVWKGILAWERGCEADAGQVVRTSLASVDAARQNVLKTIDQIPENERRAELLLSIGQPVIALRLVGPTDGSVAKVDALLALEEIPQAEAAARRAVAVQPQNPRAWLALAGVEFRNGNFKETLESCDRAAALGGPPAVASQTAGLRAEVAKRSGTK